MHVHTESKASHIIVIYVRYTEMQLLKKKVTVLSLMLLLSLKIKYQDLGLLIS